jgi:hypothetical protein
MKIGLVLLIVIDKFSEGETFLSALVHVVVDLVAQYYYSEQLVSFLIFNTEISHTIRNASVKS